MRHAAMRAMIGHGDAGDDDPFCPKNDANVLVLG